MALDELAQYSEALVEVVKRTGVGAMLAFIRDSLRHPRLQPARVAKDSVTARFRRSQARSTWRGD